MAALLAVLLLHSLGAVLSLDEVSVGSTNQLFSIEGRATVPNIPTSEWVSAAKVNVNGVAFNGFLQADGSFVVNNVPSDSYIVEVVSPHYIFPPVRVDITSKGKKRARKLDHIQPSVVVEEKYPLRIRAKGPAEYFKKRESWSMYDVLMNPMLLMVTLPFLMVMVLPKLMNTDDPERREEMQETMSMFNTNQSQMPDMAEVFTNFFGTGGSSSQKKPAIKGRATKKTPGK
jgi:hypothetical protein